MVLSKEYYMGIDIAEGSPAGKSALYSLVVIDSTGKTILVNPSVTLSRIIRVSWELRPKRMGLDNPLELAPTRKDLEKILSLFPPDLEILQVNVLENGTSQKLSIIAREKGIISEHGKLSPVRAAYVAAYLAMQGQGLPVRIIEEKTIILVTKTRSPKRGGFSQQRLQRRVRASVHIAAMKVKEALDKAGLEYDMNYRRSVGGLESAVFTVYAGRRKLYGIVRPHKGVDYSITIKPVYKTRLSLPEKHSVLNTPLIVGIDPGITTGLAVLDLSGRVVYLDSSKNFDRGEIIRLLSSLGRPLIFAIDVSEIPESVRWIAAKFGAQIYSPGQDLEAGEKRELAVKVLGKAPVDTHQRDALAAAYKAYLMIKNKLESIQKHIDEMGILIDSDRVKEEVLKGVTVAEAIEKAIEDKINSLMGYQTQTHSLLEDRRKRDKQDSSVEQLRSRIEELKAENLYLEKKLREMEKSLKIARLEAERIRRELKAEILKDYEIMRMKELITNLERRIEGLNNEISSLNNEINKARVLLIKAAKGELKLARRLPALSGKALKRSIDSLGEFSGEEVLVVDKGGIPDRGVLKEIRDSRVLGIILRDGSVDDLIEVGIPAVKANPNDDCLVLWRDLALICKSYIDKLYKIRQRIEEERKMRIDIDRIIQEYRRIRVKASNRS